MSAAEVECIRASIGEGVDVSSNSVASQEVPAEVDVTNITSSSTHGSREEEDHAANEEIIETIDTNDQVIKKSINCDSVLCTIDSTNFIESEVGAKNDENGGETKCGGGASEIESKEVKEVESGPNKETPPLRPILTNGGSSIPRPGVQTPRKKSVSFDDVDDSVKKFINGEPIVDKQNPFKQPNRVDKSSIGVRYRAPNGHQAGKPLQIDDEYITKEEVLKESKYVKTYIKNPDKYFTYDPSIVERLRENTEEHSTTRIPAPRKPIPIPRKLSKTTKERLKELTIKYSPPKFYTQERTPIKPVNGVVVKNQVDRSKYPDLADIKVKTGTDWEPGLYNPDEVAINVKKFDNRFKKAQFGSQDDLDDIAEQTDADIDGNSDGDDVNSDNKGDDGKKSFTNTVNSEEFREFLKKKGLTLQPESVEQSDAHTNGFVVAYDESDRMEGKKKRSMLQRLFNGGFFSSKGKTTPKDVNFAPGSVPKVATDDARDGGTMKRVVLERASFHHTPSHATRTSLPANNEFHKVFSGRDGGKEVPLSEDYVDMNLAPSSSKQQVRGGSDAKEIHENYIDMTPKSTIKKNIPAPQVRSTASVHHMDSSTGTNSVLDANIVYRNIDMGGKSRSQQTRLRTPIVNARAAINDGGIVRPQVQRTVQLVEKPPVLRRTPVRQSLVQPRAKLTDEAMYGNLNRSNSLPRHQTQEPPPQLPQRNTRQGIVVSESVPLDAIDGKHMRYVGGYQSSPEKKTPESVSRGPKSTSTPTERVQQTTQISHDLSPIVASTSIQVDSGTWLKIKELKDAADRNLLYSTPQSNKPIAIAENIYESTEKLRPIQYGRITGRRSSVDHQPAVEGTPAILVRNSPQRSTIDTVYRNRNLKIVDGQCMDENRRIIDPRNVNYAPSIPNNNTQHQSPVVHRERSQSVLDGLTSPTYGTVQQQKVPQEGVVMRKRQPVYLSREEILNRVKEFCRKSMNNTPTREQQHTPGTAGKASPDISPVSYASVDSRRSGRVAPQVPQRVESLQKLPESPIYAPVYRQAMPQVQRTPNPIATQLSCEEKHEIIDTRPHYQTPPGHLIQVGNQIYAPIRRPIPASMYGATTTATAGDITPYGYLHLRNTLSGIPPKAAARPSSVQGNPYQRRPLDGRSTPLVLHSINPRVEQVVYSRPIKQYPRPVDAGRYHNVPYESESGSEAGEIQRILQRKVEEDWQNDKSGTSSGRAQQQEQAAADDRRRGGRREDPRRHTLGGGDMMHYGPGQGPPPQRTMDLEMGTRSQKVKKAPPVRGYTPMNQGPLFDDDPGIMSEVETASTGFRRGGKQRSSLPVVRTPSKTLERPLGLVFLQYRSETKRALLPNEITSIDTVRALFVRSFSRQLTMAYLEGPTVKIYIHDASKDMFYELEDVRSHLREIRDRSVLRLFESNEVQQHHLIPGGPLLPPQLPPLGAIPWDQDQSYFSEPEFDSEFQHQHIHKGKGGKAPYYVGAAQTLPRGMYSDRNKNAVGVPAKPLRSYGSRGSMGPAFPYPPDQLYSIPDGYMSSPERGTRTGYEEPYYSQYGTRGSTVTPIIDEEHTDANLTEDQYALYGVKISGRIPRNPNQIYDPTRPEDLHRIRVEHMERQLANLTGLVQKALNQNPQIAPMSNINQPGYLNVPGQCRGVPDEIEGHSSNSSTSIPDKSVSFEKSVSFSDDIQGVPKSHSPQHPADSKPPKPAIKSSTLPRTSSQERDRNKPQPPPKPLAVANAHPNYRPDLALAPEVYNHLRGLQKKAKDLRTEMRTLRRLSQAQALAVREDIKDTFMRIRATLLASSNAYWGQGDQDQTRLSRDEELYKQEVVRLEKDLSDLESSVEGLRGEVINRRTRVNMAAVEDMALVLSRASKTVAELKMRFPSLQNGLRNILASEMEKVVREEKFLKEEPERLESALRRCKKLTGTLVTLKRLASVQEQRTCVEPQQDTPETTRTTEVQTTNKPIPSPRLGTVSISGGVAPENALDALLDELQTFAKPPGANSEIRPDDSTSDDSSQTLQNTVTTQLSQSSLYPSDPAATNVGLRRLHSYPSGSDTDTSPPQPRPVGKPPVPERNAELLQKVSAKRIPPPPPPRTSSRSPLASPTSPNLPIRSASVDNCEPPQLDTNSASSNDSVNSQDQMQRQMVLELRHQELLKKQKLLQEQYARLQQMSKNSIALPPNANTEAQLKKTGSESNLPQKMGLNMAITGSMKNLHSDTLVEAHGGARVTNNGAHTGTTTSKVYETEIL
ncbi:uncharacterized protein LOC129796454 isoform X5 [Lutzomyia longipalpis]|uniref:uncharacterized protein LOC129796454 isoform X5 n=1 Tax=Lutzomyia longipalpis TaxID=7200 RepID=UPI002483DF4F|nr:uncharacterized protein LOC129796454 isoform X5 [Lutzomyia longipalpis]